MSKTYRKNSDDWEYRRRQEEKKREKGASKKKFLYEKPSPPKDREKREY